MLILKALSVLVELVPLSGLNSNLNMYCSSTKCTKAFN